MARLGLICALAGCVPHVPAPEPTPGPPQPRARGLLVAGCGPYVDAEPPEVPVVTVERDGTLVAVGHRLGAVTPTTLAEMAGRLRAAWREPEHRGTTNCLYVRAGYKTTYARVLPILDYLIAARVATRFSPVLNKDDEPG
jgi:hypothetical protein